MSFHFIHNSHALLHLLLCSLLVCVLTMSESEGAKEKQSTENGAVGGNGENTEKESGKADKDSELSLPEPLKDNDPFDEIMTRMNSLSAKDRRRTLGRLSNVYGQEILLPPLGEKETIDISAHSIVHEANRNPQIPSAAPVTVETTNRKLKPFSGKKGKLPNGEVDFKHWRREAVTLVNDTEISEATKKRLLLKSLQGDAEDSVELIKDLAVTEILTILDKLWGSTVDGDDLKAEFYQILQLKDQTTSEYLNTLFIHISEVITYDGFKMAELPKELLKQFIRGTSDEDMLSKLRLEEQEDNPPDFPDLFAAVRREESRRTERRLRQKKHTKVLQQAANVLEVPSLDTGSAVQNHDEVRQLKLRIDKLEGQQGSQSVMTSSMQDDVPSSPELVQQLHQRINQLEHALGRPNQVRSRNFFCYRCGEDAHFATDCNNPPNKELVQTKRSKRKSQFQSQNQGN